MWAGHYPWHEGHTSHYASSLVKDDAHPHTQAHGPQKFSGGEAIASNEQVGKPGTSKDYGTFAAQYGTLDKTKPSNLKFYKDLDKHLPKIDAFINQSGYSPYYAGADGQKPDLANKNYNTKHLMIYAGKGGDFGEEKFTDAWRKIHEFSHAQTYNGINQKYGEGRRIGALGKQRTPREAKRAVEWEWDTVHKQRDLLKRLGVHISDEDFHKELNTVMHDAVHRAITGKFTEPSQEGFQPFNHKVPLHVAMHLIDSASKQLGLQHDEDLMKKTELTKAEVEALQKLKSVLQKPETEPAHSKVYYHGEPSNKSLDDVKSHGRDHAAYKWTPKIDPRWSKEQIDAYKSGYYGKPSK